MMFAAQRSIFVGLTVLALGVMSLLIGSPAQAAPGNGAIRISDSNCHDDDGYLACMTAEGVANETITPSGNAIYSGYVRSTFILTDPAGALVYEGSSESHFQRLDKDELMHMLSNHVSSTTTSSAGVTCTFTYAVHLANGQIQFDLSETECQ
ncbi:MAG TPA: hypothetical protein VGD58_25720 [Herpetosiphonaceae bacterium]